jgi:hypothetical protein
MYDWVADTGSLTPIDTIGNTPTPRRVALLTQIGT